MPRRPSHEVIQQGNPDIDALSHPDGAAGVGTRADRRPTTGVDLGRTSWQPQRGPRAPTATRQIRATPAGTCKVVAARRRSADERRRTTAQQGMTADADSAAAVYLRARHHAVPKIRLLVHPDDDIRKWLYGVPQPQEAWLMFADDGTVLGSTVTGRASMCTWDGLAADSAPGCLSWPWLRLWARIPSQADAP